MASTHFLLAFDTNLPVELSASIPENGLATLPAGFLHIGCIRILSFVKKNVPKHISGDILARLTNYSLSVGTMV
jgi:hypothetical protein